MWRFSPLILILWGVAKLIDNMAAQRSGQIRPPLINGGEAALLVLIVLVLAAMGIYTKVREKHPDLSIDMSMFNRESSKSEQLPAQAIPTGSHVTVMTGRGNVNIHATDGSMLDVSANETGRAANERAAADLLDQVHVVIEKTPDGYLVRTDGQAESNRGTVSVDLEISLPKSSSANVTTGHGDINVADLQGAVVTSSGQGSIEVHDTGSDVSASLTKGDARVTNTKGNVRITGQGSEIEITDVAGDANVTGEFYGPIRVRNVAKTTKYVSRKLDLTLVKLTGLLELDSSEVEVSDVAGSAKLISENKNVSAENVAGKLTVVNTNGTVKVGYSQPPREDIAITNDSSPVELTLPSNSTFEISAISKSGDVESDFDNSSLSSSNDNGTGRLAGRVGSGGPKITIVTSYGAINLRKSS